MTTSGFLNLPRAENPGTLLSHPVANGSEPIGRTTSVNYVNGWLIVGGEAPGSRVGSDLELRVYDISNPANPIRRKPSDFNLTYPGNYWIQGNFGWNAHGSSQVGPYLLPNVIRVQNYGGLVELGGTNGIPAWDDMLIGYNRSSQAGPWEASFPWYGSPNENFTIHKVAINQFGNPHLYQMAEFDHVGPYGGGDWHPMFFGNYLIYARSGGAGRDGVVVYRLQYNNFDDPDMSKRSITPHFVGSMDQGFTGYWPTFFSDGSGLYVIGSDSNGLVAAEITDAVNPSGSGSVSLKARLSVPDFDNATYPVFQDQMAFIDNRKIDTSRFLAGDPNPIVLTLDEAGAGVNVSQMSLALGNLWITGGYPSTGQNQGMGVWVHQKAADTVAPRITYHLPQANRTNYPRHAPLSFLLHEHPRNGGIRNGIDFAVRQVLAGDSLGSAVPGFLAHDFSGVVTFTPDSGLAADATYQVDFFSDPGNNIGFVDAAGNAIEAYSFRFSTGGGINAVAPPTISSVTSSDYQPAPGQSISISVSASGSSALEYRFNFEGTWSGWSSTASASHAYASEGRPQVLVQVRDTSGQLATSSLRPLVISAPTGAAPTQSNTMAIGNDPGGRRLWTVNPDANTVSVLDATTGAKVAEYSVGVNPRNIARDSFGRYWVTCQGSDEIRVLNSNGTTHTTINLAYGAAPYGVCASPNGAVIYVSLYGSSQVQRYSASSPSSTPVTTAAPFPTPRAIAVTGDGSRVFVTRFISAHLQGQVAEFSGSSLSYTRLIPLRYATQGDAGDRASGVPNYLASIAISPDGSRASVVSKQDNMVRGLAYGVGDLTHETTVRSVVSFLDLSTNQEIANLRKDFDNSDSPSAAAYTPLGDTLLVALQGNNRVVGLDTLSLLATSAYHTEGSTESTPAVITHDLASGLAPQGLLIDTASNRIFVQNFMDRTITVRDATAMLQQNLSSASLVATTDTVSTELLTAEVLLGKQIFYNADDPRMGADSYISCATCHVDGGHDGQAWDFTGRGDGLRRTTDLRGRSGMGHGNVHWSGNFDEIQDFEHDMRNFFGGSGFLNLSPTEFASQHPSPSTTKAGLSTELDALAAYVAALGNTDVPRSPERQSNGSLTAAAVRGKALFASQNCATCHTADTFTNSANESVDSTTLFDVGTLSPLSGGRLGGALSGIDTPTLHGLHASRTFLHNGEAGSLSEAFDYLGGDLYLASDAAQLDAGNYTFPAELDGGGYFRGALGGSGVSLGGPVGPALRFTNIDGGSGGVGRIAIRYARGYTDTTFRLKLNGGSAQTVTAYRHVPLDGWMVSGWRWSYIDVALNAGQSNTVEILRDDNIVINALLVSKPSHVTAAEPHRRVKSLSSSQQSDLIAYLRQLDGRDDQGVTLPDADQGPAEAPVILTQPASQVGAAGQYISMFVSVEGTGPFTYQWKKEGVNVGGNAPQLEFPSVAAGDAGDYTVTITNSVGSVTSSVATLGVDSPVQITTTSLPVGTVSLSYTQTLEASGGSNGRTWSLVSGILPTGLSLSNSGVISGVPFAAATASITVRVTDVSGSDTQSLTLQIQPTTGLSTDSDLILHYTFDEGSGQQIWDASNNGNNHVTTVSGASWVTDGRFGRAYGSSGGSSAVVAFQPSEQADLDFDPRADAFTVSAWVRTTASSGFNVVFAKNAGSSASWAPQFRMGMADSATLLESNMGGYATNYLNVSSDPINDGEWHLMTLVNDFDSGSGTWRSRLYYDDGTLVSEQASGDAKGDQPFTIGDYSFGGRQWKGQIDDFRVYKRALTGSEISALYNRADSFTYLIWQDGALTSEQLNNPSLAGPLNDADGDDIDNITEYALADGETIALAIAVVGSQVELKTKLRGNSFGITVLIESSTDLETWTPILSKVSGSSATGSANFVESPDGDDVQITILDPAAEQRKYFRLRAVSN